MQISADMKAAARCRPGSATSTSPMPMPAPGDRRRRRQALDGPDGHSHRRPLRLRHRSGRGRLLCDGALPRADGVPPPLGQYAPGNVGWHELYAADGEAKAFDFYAGQFGWTSEHDGHGRDGTYRLVRDRRRRAGRGMMDKPAQMPTGAWQSLQRRCDRRRRRAGDRQWRPDHHGPDGGAEHVGGPGHRPAGRPFRARRPQTLRRDRMTKMITACGSTMARPAKPRNSMRGPSPTAMSAVASRCVRLSRRRGRQ